MKIQKFEALSYKNKKLIILDTHPQNITFDIPLPENILYIKDDSFKYKNLGEKYKVAINKIDSDLFCIWEDDDMWLPEHMSNLVTLYNKNKSDSIKPLKMGHPNHFSILGGGDKPVYQITVNSNVCWCRFLFENKNINISQLEEPFDVSFIGLFDSIWTSATDIPTYLYRWDNGQCHMSGLYGQKSYNELYRMFEDNLIEKDISNEIIKIRWENNYIPMCIESIK